MQRLAGKVALVAGAARDQGGAHALRLTREGADIPAFGACPGFEGAEYDPATPKDLEETGRPVEAEAISQSQNDRFDRPTDGH